jgi:hypothetical protein
MRALKCYVTTVQLAFEFHFVCMYVQPYIAVEIPDTRSEGGGIMSKVAIHIGFLPKHAAHTRKPVIVVPK